MHSEIRLLYILYIYYYGFIEHMYLVWHVRWANNRIMQNDIRMKFECKFKILFYCRRIKIVPCDQNKITKFDLTNHFELWMLFITTLVYKITISTYEIAFTLEWSGYFWGLLRFSIYSLFLIENTNLN